MLTSNKKRQSNRHHGYRQFVFICLIGVFIALVCHSPCAFSANRYWNGTTGDWTINASNWGGGEPASADTAYVYTNRTVGISQPGEVCDLLYIGNSSTSTATVKQTGGALANAKGISVGYLGIGYYYQSGGTCSTSNLFIGDQVNGNGRYELSGTSELSAYSYEAIGNYGKGTFIQSGGNNSPYTFIVGRAKGSQGFFEFSGGTITVGDDAFVGLSGTGTFTHTGGTIQSGDLYVGSAPIAGMAGGTGTYTLSGTGTITAGAVTVGGDGHGTFTQSGGTNKTGRLNLDSNVVGKATYTLTGGLLDASEEYIAYQGVDAFVHSGGTNKTNYLHLGINKELSTASYDLNGTGIITANYEYLGDGGTGIFTHTSGNNTANYLYLGYGTGSNGIYTLSGTGSLSTKQLFIGYADSTVSLFQQTGGTNTASMITIGASAKFQLTGGTLNIDNGTLLNKGEIDCTDSTATLTANGGILDFSKAILENVTGMSVTMGDKSLLILPANFDPYVGFGYFFSSGLVHHAGTTLVVPADKSVNVTGWLDDPVECYGTITLQGYDFKFNQGVVVKENGKLDLGTGYLYTNDGASGMTGGTITVGGHYVGYNGKGTFNQSGGTNTPSKGLCLGYNKADEGTYILSDTGTLTTSQSEYVGYSGAGTFTQKGGSNTTSQSLVVGYSGSGTYELQSGTMNAYNESVGEYSTGFFRQSGGTNTTSSLAVSSHNPSKGTYDMIAGTLSANYLTIGYLGEGTFNQSGGEVTVPNSLALGGYYEDNEWGTIIYIGKGTYNLTGGILNAKSIAKASSRGIAVFNFGGGTIRASGTFSSALPMTLTKIGGNANFDTNNFTATLSGVLSGVGGLNKLGANSLTLSAANDFSGDTTIVRGTLLLANAAALQNSTLDYNNYGGTVSFGSLSAVSLGGLKGNQNLSLQNNNSASVALSIGGNGQSTVYGGQLSGLGSLNKIGSGALILSGGNSYLGATTVTAGILNVDNASGSATGSGTVTVKSNATLSGSGFIAGEVVLLDGGFLSPGDGIGVLTVNNAVTLKSGSNFNIEVGGLNAGNSCDRLSASGPITLAGSLNLSFGNFIPTGQDIVFLIDNSTFSATVGEFQFPQDTKIGNYCGTDWYITYDANHAAVPSLHGGNDVAIYCVPEPATWILLSLAMSFLLVISLRQNRK